MHEEEMETAIKVIVVGNGAVGKSSMIQRYCKGIFTRDYKKTIGVDFLERQIEVEGQDIRLMLWDTAGQEEFDAITKAYYRGAQACVIAYSLVDRESFNAVEDWKKKVEAEIGEISTVLVQNKTDLVDESDISIEEAEEHAAKLNLKFFRTSVKDNRHVDDVFEHLANEYIIQMNSMSDQVSHQQKIGSTSLFTTGGSRSGKHSDDNGTIVLHPSKRRTKGKKHNFLKCTLL